MNGDCNNHFKFAGQLNIAVLAVLELYYDPIQVLLELSDLPEEPTKSLCKATSLYSIQKWRQGYQILHSTVCFVAYRACCLCIEIANSVQSKILVSIAIFLLLSLRVGFPP